MRKLSRKSVSVLSLVMMIVFLGFGVLSMMIGDRCGMLLNLGIGILWGYLRYSITKIAFGEG